MTVFIVWTIVAIIGLVAAYILMFGGGPPNDSPHDPGCGGSL